MRRSYQSLAMIPQCAEDRSRWLSIWRPDEGGWHFVVASATDSKTFRESLDREVVQSLGLESRDFLVANMAQLNLEFSAAICEADELRHYLVAFYMVHLYSQRAWGIVDAHRAGRWLTGQELLAGRTEDGQPVSPWLTRLLNMSDVIT